MKLAPNAEGFFIGDYQGLDVLPSSSFHPLFVQTNSNLTNRTDVFFAP